MSGLVVVFDIGKTNVKLVAFDASNGDEVWSRSCPNVTRQDGHYPHADSEAHEMFLLDGLADATRANNGILDGIVVTTHGASGAFLKGDQLTLPVLDYEYEGPAETAEAYEALRPPFSETMSQRLPAGQNLGAQMFWQQSRFPELFNASSTFVTYPQYWAFKLCGVAATEVTSLGCHTDLWLPEGGQFSSLVEKAGWSELMAPVRRADDVLGLMRSDLAHQLGLKTPPPIFCGIQDSNASLLPYITLATPRTIISSGTWAIFFALGGSLALLNEERDNCANVNLLGEPVPTARFMGGREFHLMTKDENVTPRLQEIAHVLDAQLMALPCFAPGYGPFPHAQGRWTVPQDSLTPGEIQAVASLYLALMSNVCLNLLENSGEAIIEGPFTSNTLYCNALATLTGQTLSINHGATATATGAARLMLPPLPTITGARVAGLPSEMHSALFAYAEKWASISSPGDKAAAMNANSR
jgi:sugar (pentulose or hexulose) kinase